MSAGNLDVLMESYTLCMTSYAVYTDAQSVASTKESKYDVVGSWEGEGKSGTKRRDFSKLMMSLKK